jgi:hypothetical protein
MPLADPRNFGREQEYGYSPSGPGPYAPPVRRQVPDLQPYTGPRSPIVGGYLQSPSGPLGGAPSPASSPAWLERIRRLLGNATVGLDPARAAPPRTIRTTDPGAGYGMSPSGPTAQMPTRQQPTFRSVSHRPSGPGDFPRPSPPPSSRNPVTKPKPMSPFFEPFGGDPYTRMPFAPSP